MNQVFVIKDENHKPLMVYIVKSAFKAYCLFNDIRRANKGKTLEQLATIFEEQYPEHVKAIDYWSTLA